LSLPGDILFIEKVERNSLSEERRFIMVAVYLMLAVLIIGTFCMIVAFSYPDVFSNGFKHVVNGFRNKKHVTR
jgi:hypothetical protein